MKRLLVLTALAVVTASNSGCWHWFNRGGSCGGAPAPTCGSTYGPPATTAYEPTYGPPPMGAPAAMPGPMVGP